MRCCLRRVSSSAASRPPVNAAVRPILERYVERLRTESRGAGYSRDFLIMNGNGGMISARFVTREAAKTVMSGAGVRRHRRRLHRPPRRLPQPRHLRHGRHRRPTSR